MPCFHNQDGVLAHNATRFPQDHFDQTGISSSSSCQLRRLCRRLDCRKPYDATFCFRDNLLRDHQNVSVLKTYFRPARRRTNHARQIIALTNLRQTSDRNQLDATRGPPSRTTRARRFRHMDANRVYAMATINAFRRGDQAGRQSLENKRAELALRQCSARNYACKKDLPLWWLVLVLLLRLLLLFRPFLLLPRWWRLLLLALRLRWPLLLLLWPFLRLLTRWGRLLPIYLRRALFLLRSLLRLLTRCLLPIHLRWALFLLRSLLRLLTRRWCLLPIHLRRALLLLRSLLRLLTRWWCLLPIHLWRALLLLRPLLRLLTWRRGGALLFLLARIGGRRPG